MNKRFISDFSLFLPNHPWGKTGILRYSTYEGADNYIELTWLMFQKMIIIYPGLKIFGPFDIQTNQPVQPVK